MQQGQLLNWLKEFFARLFTKSPKFFQVINWISIATAIVTGLPGMFQELGITLPSWAEVFQNKLIAIAALVSLIISKLPTQSTPVAVTPTGEVLKKTDETKLPFTAQNEAVKSAAPGGVSNPDTPTTRVVVEKVIPETK